MIKIEAGKYYRTRDGQKVGPMNVPPVGKSWISQVIADAVTQDRGFLGWCADGFYNASGKLSQNDLVAEWRDEPDLTAITTPFGLLDRETQEALKAHGGPYEIYTGGGGWKERLGPMWGYTYAYRVKPAPPKPREWWIIGGCEAYDSLADAEDANKSMCYAQGPIHVREVLE